MDDTHSDKTTAPIGGAAPSGPALVEAIGAIRVFAGMAERDLEQLARIGQLVSVPRGQALLRAGDLADHLYFVVDGRFAILAGHERARVGEIGRGEPVGEIAFFRGGRRTADVIALRHSLVLAFARAQLDELVRSVPHFAQTILHSLASRLASATPFIAEHVRHCAPLSIAIAPAGQGVIPPSFVRDLQRTLERECGSRVFSSEFLRAMFGEWQTFSANDVVTFVEAAEQQGVCLFDCSDLPSYVAQNILAACDALLFAGSFDSDPQPSALERFAMQECAGAHMRLALVHDKAAAVYPGTARWLADRIGGAQETGHQFAMHHHVAVDDPASLARLARFITGRAIGFVGSGGGAACAAQIGVYRAFRENGVTFDYLGGTSGGAAMAAAFAHDLEPEDIHERLHDMFVIRRALSKLTLPRYSLLDHRPFDAALRAHYGETAIEDLARPYFAVSTNLSIGREHLHRSGPLWQAVRASGAIPGLLPPFYTSGGDMLVDGCLIDNLPVRLMHRLKAGPNVAVALRVPGRRYFDVAYDDLPSGFGVAAGLVNAALGRATPGAPGIAEVLALSLTLSRDSQFPQAAGGEDVLFVPPVPAGMGIMEWSRHRELSQVAFDYASERIGQLAQSADIGFAQIWASRSA